MGQNRAYKEICNDVEPEKKLKPVFKAASAAATWSVYQ